MGDQNGDRSAGIDVLPLFVGDATYAVKLDRVATVLRTGVLDDAEPGTVIELSNHTVELASAAMLLGDRTDEQTTVVVFHGKAASGHVPGWLVSGVGDPTTVEAVRPTVGSVRHVRGKVVIDDEEIVVLDPIRVHGA